MSKDEFRTALIVAGAVLIMAVGAYMRVAQLQECRRVHPIWYCLAP